MADLVFVGGEAGAVGAHRRTPAFTTAARSVDLDPKVVSGERMTPDADRLLPVEGRRSSGGVTAAAVLLKRHCLKVGWVDAASVAAQMVDLVSVWDLSDEQTIGGSMSGLPLGSAPSEHAVASHRSVSAPLPAALATFDQAFPSKWPSFVQVHHAVMVTHGDRKGYGHR